MRFWWNAQKNVGLCYRCDFRLGGIANFIRVFGHKPPEPSEGLGDPILSSPPPNFRPPFTCTESAHYLLNRGVDQKLAEEIGVQWDGYQLWFPIRSPYDASVRVEWVRRRIDQPGWMGDRIDKGTHWFCGDRIPYHFTLVEGVFDLLAPGYWMYGAALLGANLTDELEMWLLHNYEHTGSPGQITIWFDPDETGVKKGASIEERLKRWHPDVKRIHGWLFDFRDPGDYRLGEASQLRVEASQQGVPTPVRR